jgi:hypothetical protein
MNSRTDSAVRRRPSFLARLWLTWFAVYMISGALLHQQFLVGTADRVDSWTVKVIFLNIPLQLGLFFVGVVTTRSASATAVRLGGAATALAVGLAAAHLLISVATSGR